MLFSRNGHLHQTWLYSQCFLPMSFSLYTYNNYYYQLQVYQIRKDPVATLATLIFLSYAKLIEVCFKSLSFGILGYPDSSYVSLWLPDATIEYLSVKHMPLFITGVFILLVGLAFPTLLFQWQFLLHLPKWRISRLTQKDKIFRLIATTIHPILPSIATGLDCY